MLFDVEEFKAARFKVSKLLAFSTITIILIYICTGIYLLGRFLSPLWPLIPLLVGFPPFILAILFLLAFITIGTLLCFGILKIFRKHGMLFIYLAILANIILAIFLAVVSVLTGFPFAAILLSGSFLLWILIPLLFLIFFPGLVRRVARFIESTSTLMLEEPQIILPTIFMEIVFCLLVISSLGIWIGIVTAPALTGVEVAEFKLVNAISISALLSPIYYFIFTFFYFWFMSMNVGITYIWYRGRDPDLEDGVKVALSRMKPIIVFSFYTALIYLLRLVLKALAAKHRAFRDILERASGFLLSIWRGINYFTLQTLVIERLSAGESIKRSLYMLIKYIPEVVTREVFFRGATACLTYLFCGVGISLVALISILFNLPAGTFLLAAFGAIFAISLPLVMVLKTFGVSYNTLIYSWALDQELNLKIPYRLPKVVESVIEGLKKAPVVSEVWEEIRPERKGVNVCSVCKRRIGLEAYRCQVCGRIACKEHARMHLGKVYCSSCLEEKFGIKKL
jgi:hypothetical protein